MWRIFWINNTCSYIFSKQTCNFRPQVINSKDLLNTTSDFAECVWYVAWSFDKIIHVTITGFNCQDNSIPKAVLGWSEGQITAKEFSQVQRFDRRFLENQQHPPRLSKHHIVVYCKGQGQGFTNKGRHCCWWLLPYVRHRFHKEKPQKHHGIIKTKHLYKPPILYCKFSYTTQTFHQAT